MSSGPRSTGRMARLHTFRAPASADTDSNRRSGTNHRGLWLMASVVFGLGLGLSGCKKEAAKSGPEFKRAYTRLQAAVEPADFEWPLKKMAEVIASDAKPDIKAAARFELARGWLRLGVLSSIPRDRQDANRVLKVTKLEHPKLIVEHLTAVAGAAEISGSDLPKWAKQGLPLAKALGTEEGGTPAQRHTAVSTVALSDSPFAADAGALIFSYLIRVPPKAQPGQQAPPDAFVWKQTVSAVRYACPKAAEAHLGKTRATSDLAKFQAACSTSPLMVGRPLAKLAQEAPCPALPLVGDHPDLRTTVAAFFNRLLTSYSNSGAPPAYANRFPVEGGCALTARLMDELTAPIPDVKAAP